MQVSSPRRGSITAPPAQGVTRSILYPKGKPDNWRCPADSGIIKKGVSDRTKELSHGSEARPRPPYTRVIPLAQIIRTMENASSPNTKKCKAIYSSFISTFGNEIAVLIDTPVPEIRTIHEKVADAITALRGGTVRLIPGGGGKYGYVLARLTSFATKE